MSQAVVIPAQEINKHHELGDLAPFGGSTLLEWKVAQCKELVKPSKIYISSNSSKIEDIAKKEGVNFIRRYKEGSYSDMIVKTLKSVKEDTVLWTNSISPFIGYKDYISMIQKYESDVNIHSMVSVHSKYDYAYYQNIRLNFSNKFTPRINLTPVRIVTNGCYIVQKKMAIEKASLYDNAPFLYELDYLSSIEINDIHTYQISKELITSYFKRDLDV
jgi:CMP-N-acetylneuraminic acid synthetase